MSPRRGAVACGLALVLLALAPSLATAAWTVHQSTEPDTAWDLTFPAHLSAPAADDPARRVYFNVVLDATARASLHPNVAALGSRLSGPMPTPMAFLGVWRDCNGDGFVGAAQGALLDYHVTLLADAAACPPGSEHIVGQWVHEFLWIGDVGPGEDVVLPGILRAPGTRIWGDLGYPGMTLGLACIMQPLPRGTTGSTGGLVGYADCQNQRGLASTVNAVDEDGSLGLRFDDPADPKSSDSRLNQPLPVHPFDAPQNPEGQRTGAIEEGTGDPAVAMWDCSEPEGTTLRDPTAPSDGPGLLWGPLPGSSQWASDSEGYVLRAPRLAPSVDAHGSFVDAAQDASNGPGAGNFAHQPCRGSRPVGVFYDFAEGVTPGAGLVEGDEGGTLVRPHRETDYYFRFGQVGTRIPLPEGSVPRTFRGVDIPPPVGGMPYPGGALPPDDVPRNGGADTPLEYGTGAPRWREASGDRPERLETPLVTRDTYAPRGPSYRTYYAQLPVAFLPTVTLPGPAGSYGAEWCAGGTREVVRGFDCDGTRWWNPDYGASPEPHYPPAPTYGMRPESSYHLRDIDCHDQEVAADLRLALTEEACA